MRLTNWGNYPVIETSLLQAHTEDSVSKIVTDADTLIPRGLGRCYGDTALNEKLVLSTLRLDKMLSFDEASGVLVAEAGVSLAKIAEWLAPRGWFVPVTPGTQFVTLGGAVASDVHGKNHHVAATFGQHVVWFDILTPAKGVLHCSPASNTDLFHATCGGMGLTGIILRVAVKLDKIPSVWIRQRGVKTRNLAEIMVAFDEYGHYPFSVAWIDCLKEGPMMGRSFLMAGDWAKMEETANRHAFTAPQSRNLNVPLNFPSIALNSLSVRAFNALYYAKAPKGISDSTVSFNTFFYPLDAIHNWNRIYGKRGFTQYQFVIPSETGKEALPKILAKIAASGQGSFLAVLKLFGKQPAHPGNISFPMEGYTLALDFPVTKALFPLLDTLDDIVLDYGGRHYLAKDSRMSEETFRRGYGKALEKFLEVKACYDPANLLKSLQSQRLGLK